MQCLRALISQFYYDPRQQFSCGAFEEVISEAIGQPRGFQVVFDDDGVPFLGDGGDVAGAGRPAPF